MKPGEKKPTTVPANTFLARFDKKYFTYHQNLEIAYDYYLTTVSFRYPRVHFGEDGFFEPEAILWYGYMSHARIADWLPYEYSPGL